MNLSNLKVYHTSAERLEGVPDNSADRAVFLFSLHHVEDIEESIKTVRQKIKENGLLYILDPIKSRFFGHGTTPSTVLRVMSDAGFRVTGFKSGLVFWKALAHPV